MNKLINNNLADAPSVDELFQQCESDQDYYASHLANVSETNPATATQDIVNEKGIILVKHGNTINQGLANQLLNHKLLKPLEEQVELENMVSGETLYETFIQLSQQYLDLDHIHKKLSFDALFKDLCINNKLPSILLQKLTVMSDNQPLLFKKGIFSAWISTMIAHEMGLPEQQILDSFHAGLLRDLGFLHLSPEILDKKGQLSPAEWRSVQSHVIVGSMIIKRVDSISPIVAQAILEHHERTDGAGYPVGKIGETLSTLGQIVAMADAIQAQRMRQLEDWGLSLRYIEAFLFINSQTHTHRVYRAMHNIIRQSALPEITFNPFESNTAFRDNVVERNLQLQVAENNVASLKSRLEATEPSDKSSKGIYVQIAALELVFQSSGVLGNDITQWLQQSAPNDADISNELTEIYLLQHEICWHLKNLAKNYGNHLEQKESAGKKLPIDMAIMAKTLHEQAHAISTH